ncbi:hypothetical protein HPP92_007059 [Vanilla planifolia]|uniref:Uncharacterized protein n=1 Tax=Vanilla planifolia TaxID=51239 RepID=A0A835VBI4_VANPL|nr:hypothetical protein HPP92_007059 [Vanilla planifolia]
MEAEMRPSSTPPSSATAAIISSKAAASSSVSPESSNSKAFTEKPIITYTSNAATGILGPFPSFLYNPSIEELLRLSTKPGISHFAVIVTPPPTTSTKYLEGPSGDNTFRGLLKLENGRPSAHLRQSARPASVLLWWGAFPAVHWLLHAASWGLIPMPRPRHPCELEMHAPFMREVDGFLCLAEMRELGNAALVQDTDLKVWVITEYVKREWTMRYSIDTSFVDMKNV